MAIIGKIRQRSWILFGFIAVALLIFILEAAFDKNSMFGGGSNKNSIASINGEKVSVTDYSEKINNYQEGLKLLNPNIQFNDQVQSQIQEEVWTNIAADNLLADAYKSLGLTISEGEMGELMWGTRPHPIAQNFIMRAREVQPEIIDDKGQINQARIREFIKNIDQTDKQYKTNFKQMLSYIEPLIKEDVIKQKYASLVSQSFYMPTFMAKEVVSSTKSATAGVVAVPYSALADDKYKVTDDEITKYIKEHKEQFEQEETRVVDVVSFDILPSSEDTAQAIQRINTMRTDYLAVLPKDSAYIARNSIQGNRVDFFSREEVAQTNRNADTLFSLPVGTLTNVYKEGSYYMFTKILDRKVAPDTVRAAHILLSLNNKTDEDKKAANALADSLIRIIASGAKNFGQVAVENSLDKGSKDKGGDLGYFARGQMVKPFNDRVFYSGMLPNQIAKVESDYGLHIILLIDMKAPKVMTKFADFAVELVPGDETEKLAYDNAAAFQQKNNTAALFDKAAKTEALAKNVVLSQNMKQVQQLGEARKMVQWAFQQEKTGGIEFFDNENKYMIAKLSKVMHKGLPKAEDVREEVSILVRNEKKGKDLVNQLNTAAAGTTDLKAIAAKVKDAQAIDTVMARYSAAYVQPFGNEPKLVGTIFGVPVGKTSKAVAGERAAFIVQTRHIDENTPEMSGDINQYKQQMQQMYISRMNIQTILESIIKKSDVTDTRYKFY